MRKEWMAKWLPRLTSNDTPLSPYRVIWDLLHTVDVKNTIITHDAGSPRDQLSPFWHSTEPLSYIGWGKTTQLGYGLGLAMGAKLAKPDKLCINVWGDAAIGFTGMDFETAVRERIPIMSILLNNFSMAIELKVMPISTEKYRSTDISGDYAAMARAFGGYGERVTEPDEIIPAIKRGIAADARRASRCCSSSSPARKRWCRGRGPEAATDCQIATDATYYDHRNRGARPGLSRAPRLVSGDVRAPDRRRGRKNRLRRRQHPQRRTASRSRHIAGGPHHRLTRRRL